MSKSKTIVESGQVKFFNAQKGFGFIVPDEGEADLFFHATKIVGKQPDENDRVIFEIEDGKRGLCAVNVSITES